ncbi:MAG: hypothetical protein KF767_08565 [Bdellovibrionaceae bacterium]|nr:hypothetical protein [Pseudobdellovibrionaceae bacterium]
MTAAPSNELQPAGLARLRPGQRFAVTAQSIGDSKYEIEGYSNFNWIAGPFYQFNQPERNGLKETAYGVKFGTEIIY